MQRFSFAKFFFIICIISFTSLSAFCQDSLYEVFHEFSPNLQGLTETAPYSFPQNITIEIQSATEKTKATTLNHVIFAFTEDFVKNDLDSFISFIKNLKEKKFSFLITILVSANDDIPYFRDENSKIHPFGTSVFSSSLNTNDSVCAIIIGENKKTTVTSILPGGNGDTSPLWLVQSLKIACKKTSIPSTLPGSPAFLYRFGFIDDEKRISCFLQDSIPAAGLFFANTPENHVEISKKYECILNIAHQLEDVTSTKWDRHYSNLHIDYLGMDFWFNETFYILCYLLFAFFVLLKLSFSTFASSIKNIAIVKDISRTWYYIFFLIFILTITLHFGQNVLLDSTKFGLKSDFYSDPTFLLGQKIVIAFFSVILVFTIQNYLKIFTSLNLCSSIIHIVSVANIFIFSCIDVSFLFLFFFEYLFCIFAKNSKSKIEILISLILMLIPFVPHILNISLSTNPQVIRNFAHLNIWGNILLSLILVPFVIQFLKLLIIYNFFSKRDTKNTFVKILKSTAFIALSTFFFGLSYFSFVTMIVRKAFSIFDPSYQIGKVKIFESPEASISISCSEDEFMDFSLTKLEIIPKSDSKILRYDVFIKNEDTVPLFDCNYEYSFSGKNKAIIHIPDYPQKPLSIVFTKDKQNNDTIEIITYIEKDNLLTFEKQIIKTGE